MRGLIPGQTQSAWVWMTYMWNPLGPLVASTSVSKMNSHSPCPLRAHSGGGLAQGLYLLGT